jgi:DNA polymerase I-like protein with 3'-5' exonuclease and polymerase domains
VFEKRYRPEHFTSKHDYELSCPIDEGWTDKSQRVLVVLETIDGQDLKEGKLLSDRSRTVVTRLLRHSIEQAEKEVGFKAKRCGFAALNFNAHKFFDQPKETWPGHRRTMARRVLKVINHMEPTHVMVFGDWAMKALLPTEEYLEKKRGWTFDLDANGHKCKISGHLDLQPLYSTHQEDIDAADEEEGESDVFGKSNLLYYVSRTVIAGLNGKLLYDLSHIKPNVKHIKTMDGFDKLHASLMEAEIVAVDTETLNGSVNHNAIHTIQFAMGTDKSYLLPIDHPQTPFSKKERRIIKAKLRQFFYAKPKELPLKYLIMQYGTFDLRVLRVELGIPVIFHKVWEIQAGEWCLDENLKYLAASPFNTPQFGLEQIFMNYGNDHYKTAPFGKGDRSNPNLTRLDNPDFINYGGMDVQSIFGIHEQQLKRSEYVDLNGKPYFKWYKRLVVNQFSNTVHVLSTMKQAGSSVDREYLQLLAGPDSPLKKLIKQAKLELMTFKEVMKANRILLGESSGQAGNRGLFNKIQTIFKWGTAEHKKLLFFGVMDLKPVSRSKITKQPKVDKLFVKTYEEKYPVVKKFGEYTKLTKLYGTYVKGWLKVLMKNVDSIADFRLRPDYAFFPVVTGRLNSQKPSLQQVPAHGDAAKYIKRMFIALPGLLLIKFDYSAHEIRCWSYVGLDHVLAKAFRQGQKLRQMFRAASDPELREQYAKELKTKGDLHIWNAFLFFGKWIEKSDPLRDAIKKIVFGVIYGKGVKTLAKDIKQEEEYAERIIKKLYKTFPKAGAWLQWSMNHALEHLYTFSPIGMRRNLFGIMTGIQNLVSAMRRRAANSPIQGLASQIGVTAAYLITVELWKVLTKFGFIDEDTEAMPLNITKAVHDALHTESPYEVALIATHVIQWTATYGVTQYYKDVYGIEFTIEPEIEMEFGASEDKMYKWDWTNEHLFQILRDSVNDQHELGFCRSPDKAYTKIMSVYEREDLRAHLETRYPILGIPPVKPLKKPKKQKEEVEA